jgi:hypothetical protein
MEEVAQMIASMNPVEQQWKPLREGLLGRMDVIMSASTAISGDRTTLQRCINSLLDQPFTVGIAVLLAAQTEKLPDSHGRVFVDQAVTFFARIDTKQLQYVMREIITISEKMVNLACKQGYPRTIIKTLANAATLLSPTPQSLNPMHAHLLQVSCCCGHHFCAHVLIQRQKTCFVSLHAKRHYSYLSPNASYHSSSYRRVYQEACTHTPQHTSGKILSLKFTRRRRA